MTPSETRAANRFATRIVDWQDEGEIIREGLAYETPRLIAALQNRNGFATMSLRNLAKAVGLSVTYLSCVDKGHIVASPGAYLKLWNYFSEVQP